MSDNEVWVLLSLPIPSVHVRPCPRNGSEGGVYAHGRGPHARGPYAQGHPQAPYTPKRVQHCDSCMSAPCSSSPALQECSALHQISSKPSCLVTFSAALGCAHVCAGEHLCVQCLLRGQRTKAALLQWVYSLLRLHLHFLPWLHPFARVFLSTSAPLHHTRATPAAAPRHMTSAAAFAQGALHIAGILARAPSMQDFRMASSRVGPQGGTALAQALSTAGAQAMALKAARSPFCRGVFRLLPR